MAARCTTPPVAMHHSSGNDAPSSAVRLHFLCGVCIRLPENITAIEEAAFEGCTNLEEIKIPDTVTTNGDDAFSGCSGLKEIILPETVKEIGDTAFMGCENLTKIHIPANVQSIEEYAFEDCENLTIYTPATSYAEQYAKENGIAYVTI